MEDCAVYMHASLKYLIWRQQGFGESCSPVNGEARTSDLHPPIYTYTHTEREREREREKGVVKKSSQN